MYTHLRDVIYVLCVYIFWLPLYIYIQEVPKNVNTFKRCYLCIMCIHFLASPVYIYIYILLNSLQSNKHLSCMTNLK